MFQSENVTLNALSRPLPSAPPACGPAKNNGDEHEIFDDEQRIDFKGAVLYQGQFVGAPRQFLKPTTEISDDISIDELVAEGRQYAPDRLRQNDQSHDLPAGVRPMLRRLPTVPSGWTGCRPGKSRPRRQSPIREEITPAVNTPNWIPATTGNP